jgi:hypothetical protein
MSANFSKNSNDQIQPELKTAGPISHQRKHWHWWLTYAARIAFILFQSLACAYLANGDSANRAWVAVLVFLVTAPIYALKRPHSPLHVRPTRILASSLVIVLMLANGWATGATPADRGWWLLLMIMVVSPTFLFVAFPFAAWGTWFPYDEAILDAIVVAAMWIAFYLQWFRFVPWLFSAPSDADSTLDPAEEIQPIIDAQIPAVVSDCTRRPRSPRLLKLREI